MIPSRIAKFALIVLLIIGGGAPFLAGPAGAYELAELGTLRGRVVMADGKALPTGFVAFFGLDKGPNQDTGTSKRAPTMVAFIKDNGAFVTGPFPPGDYSLGAMLRERWQGGPPRSDEKRYSAFDKDGKYQVFSFKAGQNLDVGTVVVREPTASKELKSFFTVQGRVLDAKGQGLAGAVVVVKEDLDNPKGLYISPETAKDGSYALQLPPGRFFFVARQAISHASGRPKPGSLMGTLGQNKPLSPGGNSEDQPAYIIGREGDKVSGVDIIMFKIPVPDVKRKEIEKQVKAKKIDKGSLPNNLPLMKKEQKGAPYDGQSRLKK